MATKVKQRSTLRKQLMTVTPLSKTIAFILFILMPFIGFYIGMQYQKTVDTYTSTPSVISQAQ